MTDRNMSTGNHTAKRSKAERLTATEAAAYVAAHQNGAEGDCEHGHLGCANREGGPCLDELLGLHPELAD